MEISNADTAGLEPPGESRCHWCVVLLIVTALGVASLPRTAFAQSDQADRESESSDNSDSERAGIEQFESVDIERVKPLDLPKPRKPGGDIGIRTQPEDVPKAPTQKQIKGVLARVEAATLRVAIVKMPPKPYRQEPTVHFGHAVWIERPSQKEATKKTAVLVSSLNWLAGADEVYVVPPDAAPDDETEPDWRQVRKRTLESVTVGASGREWLRQNEDDLVEATLVNADEHRDLVTLDVDNPSAIYDGHVQLFDYESRGLFYAYGFSPFFGSALVQTTIAPSHPENVALSYFLQTTFPAALGAPIVSSQGTLVTITAFRHPDKEGTTLAIPTNALESYLAPDTQPDQE